MFQGTSVTYSKSKNSSLINKHLNYGKKRITVNKTRVVNSKSERIVLKKKPTKISISNCTKNIQTPDRRETYLIDEKENLLNLKTNVIGQENIFNSPSKMKQRFRHADNKFQNNDFNFMNITNDNLNCSLDSLDEPLKKTTNRYSLFNDFCLTPLKSTENILSPFSTTSKSNSFNTTNMDLASNSFSISMFKPIEASTADKTYEYTPPEKRQNNRVSVNLKNLFEEDSKDNLNRPNKTYVKELEPFRTSDDDSDDKESSDVNKTQEWVNRHVAHNHTSNVST